LRNDSTQVIEPGDYHISDDVFDELYIKPEPGGYRRSLHPSPYLRLPMFLERPSPQLYYMKLFSRLKGKKGICVLSAHGDRKRHDQWYYVDGGESHSMQAWIEEQDGKYLALFLDSCNPNSSMPTTRESILFYPRARYSPIGQFLAESYEHPELRKGFEDIYVEMYVPWAGIINIDDKRNFAFECFLLEQGLETIERNQQRDRKRAEQPAGGKRSFLSFLGL